MSLSHLTINETATVDTWNQPRSSEQLKGLLSRLSHKAFADTTDDLQFDF